MADLYCFPDVGRTGLGNMLFSWARAEICRARHGIPMLAPQWTQLKIGPLLRRERDLRYYTGLFSHRGARYVGGLRKYWILSRSIRVPQAQTAAFLANPNRPAGRHVLVYSGWQGWFDGITGERQLVADRLHAILSPRVRALLNADAAPITIAVHVRRGDKKPLPFGAPFTGDSGTTIHDQWYINAIASVRRALGEQAPVRIFSDARPSELGAILSIPHTTLSPEAPSIVDILQMARSRALISTAGSSFSAWSFFLGAMPTVFYPGTRQDLVPGRPDLAAEADLEGNLDPAALPAFASSATGTPT